MPRPNHSFDRPFLFLAAALTVVGLFILASASSGVAQEEYGNPFFYVTKQLVLGASVGLIGAALAHILPLRWFRIFAPPAFFLTIALLLAVIIPGVGVGTKGATRWIPLGPITIQPGELAKVTVPLYLAAWFTAHRSSTEQPSRRRKDAERIHLDGEVFLPFLFLIGLVGLPLLLQPDLSTFGIIALTALLVYFLAGAPLRNIVALIAAGIGSLFVLIQLAPYRMNRILGFLNPKLDPLGIGYHVQQALLAVGSGGIFGRGLGFSREKLFFLPEPMGDSIFAIFAEEAGFVGASALIVLFLAFVWRGFVIAKRLPDSFLRLATAGLIGWIGVQAFLNIAGNIALAPLIGITLPFVSYGSASFAVTLTSVGIVLRFSRYTEEDKE